MGNGLHETEAAAPDPPLSERPLVSVLIPLYNHERFIGRCLESLRETGYRPLEGVVLDDGSTDGSSSAAAAWAARLREPGLTVQLHREPNRGLPGALNRLAELARGELFVILASDDFLLPGGVEVRWRSLRAHPEWLGVFGDAVAVDEEGRTVHASALEHLTRANKRALLDARFIARELILRWGVPGGALMVRRSAYDPEGGIGPYDASLSFEDRDFYLRGLARGAIGFVDALVSAYRIHPENTFKTVNSERLKRLFRDLRLVENHNARLFRGLDAVALRALSRLAEDRYRELEGDRPARLRQGLLWKLVGALYRWHSLQVRLRGRRPSRA